MAGDDCSNEPWIVTPSGGKVRPESLAAHRAAPVIVTELIRVEGRSIRAGDVFAAKIAESARTRITSILKAEAYKSRGLACP